MENHGFPVAYFLTGYFFNAILLHNLTLSSIPHKYLGDITREQFELISLDLEQSKIKAQGEKCVTDKIHSAAKF